MMKRCPCGERDPQEFYPSSRYMCKACCREARKRSNPTPTQARAYQLKTKYRMSVGDYEEMLERQGGGCLICGSEDPKSRSGCFHVDHDHRCCSGTRTCGDCVRGLLCARCNTGLGYFNDSSIALARASDYVLGCALETA